MADDQAGLTIRGGGTVRASRAELDRVRYSVDSAQQVLIGELSPFGFFDPLASHITLALELPGLLARMDGIRHGCLMASEQYFGGESAIANRINAVARVDVPQLAGGALAATAGIGLLREGDIEISRTGFAGATTPPHSVVELALRLQKTSTDGDLGSQAEFRIERYGSQVIVYIPGTKEWSLKAGENPLDLTSNVHAMQRGGGADSQADQSAASERSVLAALRSAGVGAKDQVLLVGHSQGGIIAANIAAESPYQIAGIVTFGSPIAVAQIAPTVNVLALEHTNDPVPTLDGGPNALRENWVTVREHYEFGPGDTPIAAHDLAGYIETAGRLDASKASRAKGALEFLRGFAGREAGRTEWFTARRVG